MIQKQRHLLILVAVISVAVFCNSTTTLAGEPPSGMVPVDWLLCESNADCVDAYAGCFEAAVNKRFADQAKELFREASSTMDCKSVTQPTLRPICNNGLLSPKRCRLIHVIK
jgi:hypothetical protein